MATAYPITKAEKPGIFHSFKGFMRAVSAVVWKDLAAELRSRELLSAMLVFALLGICAAGNLDL